MHLFFVVYHIFSLHQISATFWEQVIDNNGNYQLLIRGKKVKPMSVSVGERNAIALAFFFTHIFRDKNLKSAHTDEYFLVIDDPISSFDFENKIGVHSFFKWQMQKILDGNPESRIIVMSHDWFTIDEITKGVMEILKKEEKAIGLYLLNSKKLKKTKVKVKTMLKLATIFKSGMVLQREKEIALWGEIDIPQTISVFISDQLLVETACKQGHFKLMLPAQKAAEDCTIKICGSRGDWCVLENIDIGEVWVAGGQSNMEFLLKWDAERTEMIAAAHDAHFRYYEVSKFAFDGEEDDCLTDTSHWNKWLPFTPEHAPWFSAVSVYFALQLRKNLGVPVGIVGCNWGGTTAATWMDAEVLKKDSALEIYTNTYASDIAKIDMDNFVESERKSRVARQKFMSDEMQDNLMTKEGTAIASWIAQIFSPVIMPKTLMNPHSVNRPGGLYEMMLKQITGLCCRGVIWYQGELDENRADLYGKLFTAMIACWRRDWGEELPFLFVQLAPWWKWMGLNGKNYPTLRAQQEKVSKTVSNVWMASIMDSGSQYDIHPKNKRPVGERLALLAQGKVYGENILCDAPEAVKASWNGEHIEIEFQGTGGNLHIFGNELNALVLKVNEKKHVIKRAQAQGDILRFSPDVKPGSFAEIQFANVPYCKVNLFNGIGIPAKPFVMQI